MSIKKELKIEKLNILNEMKSNNMLLTEIRFFSIFLSKINARDITTRQIKFTVSDFKKIMELKRVRIEDLQRTTNGLLSKIVNIPVTNGGYEAFQLFKECKVYKDENNEWYITIDAHDKALPLMFEFKEKYFTYELWNALRLGSSNQIRMYELLKQHQKQGEWTFSISELRELLFIEKQEYPRFGDFKNWVIEKARKALADHTDIYFNYELIKKGAKVIAIKFIIHKNENYIDQLTLDEFIINQQEQDDIIDYPLQDDLPLAIINPKTDACVKDFSFFSDAFSDEFSIEQVEELYQISVPLVKRQSKQDDFDLKMYDYFTLKITQLNAKQNIKYRYNYLKKLIEIDIEEQIDD